MKITRQDTRLELTSGGSFNRYILTYSATVPLRCEIAYVEAGGERAEEFFLEAGENMTFSSYIDGYLRHRTADAALYVTARTITYEDGELELHGFAAEIKKILLPKNKE